MRRSGRLALLLTGALLLGMVPVRTEAETGSALDAFYHLLAEEEETENTGEDDAVRQLLEEVISGRYLTLPESEEDLCRMAEKLNMLAGITDKKLAACASDHDMRMAYVKNLYYRSLAMVLKAKLRTDPAVESRYRDVQKILELFLETESVQEAEMEKDRIRQEMSPEYSREIAQAWQLPDEFVSFLLMDSSWNDENWENDETWMKGSGWLPTADFEEKMIGSRDSDGSAQIYNMQEALYELGYLRSAPDGIFGPRTQAALLEFQLANGLTADGIFDSMVYRKLTSTEAVSRRDYGAAFLDRDDWDDDQDDDGWDDDDWDDDDDRDDDDWDDDDDRDDDDWDDDDGRDDDDWDDDDDRDDDDWDDDDRDDD